MWLQHLLARPPHGDIADNWPFERFAAATAALAGELQGVSAVGLWFEDGARFASALLAAWQAGADVYLPPDPVPVHLDWAEAAGCLWLTDNPAFPRPHRLYDAAAEQAQAHSGSLHLPPHRRLFLKTSGSSGEAKILCKTLAQMESEAAALAAVLPESWRGLPAEASVSPQHLYGLTFRIFAALACGWRLGRGQCRYPEDLAARSRSPCIWISSPTLLNALTQRDDLQALCGQVRGIVSAGGRLPENVSAQLAAQTGITPLDVYGSSETGAAAARQGGGAWTLLPPVCADTGADGLLRLQSPWTDGVQATADAAEVQGRRLVLHGRGDRIVKWADKRLSLDQMEQDLRGHEWVADAHCAPHPRHQRIAAWVALNADGIAAFRRQGKAALCTALKTALARTQARTALPRHWCFAAGLPRNAQSKIRRADFVRAFTAPPTAPDWQAHGENEAGEWRFSGSVPLSLPCFGGHFAAFPLVPGVTETEWVLALTARLGWGTAALTQIENLKFQKFVRPHDRVEIRLRRDTLKNKVYFSVCQSDGGVCASGRLVFQAA